MKELESEILEIPHGKIIDMNTSDKDKSYYAVTYKNKKKRLITIFTLLFITLFYILLKYSNEIKNI